MMWLTPLILLLSLLPPAGTTAPPDAYSSKLRIYEDFVRSEMERQRIPGMTIGFSKDDFTWVEGFGFADLENRVPAKATSSYRLASITKSMTAVAVLQLAEQGTLDLDAEVQAYLPYFPRKNWPITVRQLLLHLSGMRHNIDAEKALTVHLTTREAVEQYADSDLLAEPGTQFNYSSPGYVLLGAIVESTSGKPYADYMRDHLWEPLGMQDTRMDDPSELIPNRVRGYRLVDGQIRNSQFVDVSNRFAAGGVRTTIVDLLKFARGLDSGRVLSPRAYDALVTSGTTRDGRVTDTGMGWFLGPVNGRMTLTNNGGQPETRTVLYVFPKARFAIALAMNFEINDYMTFVERLYQVVLDERWRLPWEKSAFTKDEASSVLLQGMHNVFVYGLSAYERCGRAASSDPREIEEAFRYFNENTPRTALTDAREQTLKNFEDGVSPLTGEPLVRLGSFMAARIAEQFGSGRLDTYHALGPITFFADFVALNANDPSCPAGLRFSPEFEEQVARWDRDWRRTNSAYVRQLWISPGSDVFAVAETLRQQFRDAEVYPHLNAHLSERTWQCILRGDRKQAECLAQLEVDLYPRSDLSFALLAMAKIISGDNESARPLLRRAEAINGTPASFSRGLQAYARLLAGAGRTDDGLSLLRLVAELQPADPAIYESMGEMYSRVGDRAKAIEACQTAIRIDPSREGPRQLLDKLSMP